MFLGYVKDCNDIASRPKAFVRVSTSTTSTIKVDLLTTAKSTFTVISMPSNVNVGDIFIVYDSKGFEWYKGKITSYANNKITCTQIQEILNGVWLCKNFPSSSLENEIKSAIEDLISGRVGNLTDEYIANKYSNFVVNALTSTEGQLPTYELGKTMDFEKFVYQMYDDYGIKVDVVIPYEGTCQINVYKPDYESTIIGDNTNVISSIDPTTEIEQYNKLIVFGNDKTTYRATYVVTSDVEPTIVKLDDEEPLNRFVETKTKIVFSNDELNTIVDANLTTEMYNHKVTFQMALNNKLYDWNNLRLGQPLEIWSGVSYFNTIYTGYEMVLPTDSSPTNVKMICGKVRTSLTEKILMGGKL